MDVKKGNIAGFEVMELWTNERHLDYLSFMEASFVRRMFRNTEARPCAPAGDVLPLDRQIPDCLESTRDLKLSNHGRKEMNEKKKMSRRNDKSVRRRRSQPYDTSPDQVVPQIVGKSTKSDNEGDERCNE